MTTVAFQTPLAIFMFVRAVTKSLLCYPLLKVSGQSKHGQPLNKVNFMTSFLPPRPLQTLSAPQRPLHGDDCSCYCFLTLVEKVGLGPGLLSRASHGRCWRRAAHCLSTSLTSAEHLDCSTHSPKVQPVHFCSWLGYSNQALGSRW